MKKTTKKQVLSLDNESTKIECKLYQLDSENKRCFEYTIKGIELNDDKLSESYVIGTCVQRIADLMRFYKRNGSKLLKATKDVYFSVNVLTDVNESVNWFNTQQLNEDFCFKLRAGYTTKANRKLAERVLDTLQFRKTGFKIRQVSEIE